ncbi:TIGR02679 family protein [Nocardia pseudovaccinii]|uniref:TIGR02679 family protein n=1 Tax=Nocardia pseudovaccinii TaxID=189540 RepID=UPI003D91EF74
MTHDPVRLAKILGGADTDWLVDRVAERLARGLSLAETISLKNPTAAQRMAVDQLLGRRASTGASVTVPLAKLDAALKYSGIHPDGLAAAVAALRGPVVNRASAGVAAERAWAEALQPLWEYCGQRTELLDWWTEAVRSGLVRRLAGDAVAAGPLILRLQAVLAALPAERELLGALAARVVGGAHALDPGEPLATLTLSAARELGGVPDGADRRTTWAAVGVVVDELSSTVLTVGLPGDSHTATGRVLREFQRVGQPVVLTLRQLLRDPPVFISGQVISICENPAVVAAAADRHGPACLPLVCTSGQPGAAVLRLLELAVGNGARLRYHGDFDWYGIAIANFLRSRFAWAPWRFDHQQYRAAVAVTDTPGLTGKPVTATWDPDLRHAMRELGKQVEEEAVLEDLLTDLAPTPPA